MTKNASAAQRSTIDSCRTLVVWVFFMVVQSPAFHEGFHWLELIGFIILVAGTLVYNEIIIVPYFGFDKNTKVAIEARKKQLQVADSSYDGTLGSPNDEQESHRMKCGE